MAALILIAGSAAEYDDASLACILLQQRSCLISHYSRVRVYKHLVALQVGKRCILTHIERVARDMAARQRLEPGGAALPGEGAMPYIVFAVPLIVIITN
ncbi:hypothetical protein D3C80_1930330 [compost metagenome]